MTEEIEEGWKQVVFLEPKNLNELYKTYEYWLYLTDKDKETIDIVLAAALDRDIPGDPFWIYLISPPGGLKTELVRALNMYDKIYSLDSITPATLVSGKVAKSKEDGKFYPIAGILRDLDGKVLVVKDFTVILSEPDITRTAIYGQLRAIHDGYFEKGFGTLKQPIRVHANIGMIAAVTPAIDHYTKAHNILGERFLKIRQHPDSELTTQQAFKNLGKEEKMREHLATATAYYLKHVRINEPFPKPTKQQMDELIKMAQYISLMRTRVMGYFQHGLIVEPYSVEPEVPTRVVKQLKKLIIGLAVVRQHGEITNEDMETIKRVTKDCSIPIRQKIVEGLATYNDPKGALSFEIETATKLPRNTVINELIRMQLLGIVEVTETIGKEKEDEDKKARKEEELEYFAFTTSFKELYAVCKGK